MTYYLIYEIAFPFGFGLLALLCLGFALAGFSLKRPLVYSAEIPLMGIFLFLTPMFMISLRHIIAPPYFSGYGIYLNSFLSLLYPLLAYFSLGLMRGHTVLGLKPRRLREQIRSDDPEHPPRVIGFPFLAMTVVVPRKGQSAHWTRERVVAAIRGAEGSLGFSSANFLPTLFLGLFVGFVGFWCWSSATRWSPAMNSFTSFMSELKP